MGSLERWYSSGLYNPGGEGSRTKSESKLREALLHLPSRKRETH